ncbi:High-affinity branched-chain amino acid transport ATP-binding protein (Partial match) [Frankia sp. AiPs1]|uniref:ATP-binding cassette domain-containing protein n=1 Tax=Frankia sp. AiPa1 TaxID=573492 RepID=UPI00202AE60A|nr:ATP-binding cassette domain-containing protein [Frankia sp. AiPa1]MCL9762148.1 ATP-binding cassette domain-containing protein [Frankia sp. AiPa1]
MNVQPNAAPPGATRLAVAGLSAGQGDTRIVEDVAFTLPAGSVIGLIGPNGAGKTTLIDALTGFAAIFSGEVMVDGVSLIGLPAHARARHGLARTFQALELFDSLDVEENLAVVATAGAGVAHPGAAHDEDARPATVRMDGSRTGEFGLEAIAGLLPSTLTHDERASVALGRALAGRPGVLLLDEPAAGLDPADRHKLADRIRRIAGDGVAVLLVDHDLQLVFDVCDHVLVLDGGRIVADGRPEAVRADPAVRAAYLGEIDAPPAPGASSFPGAPSAPGSRSAPAGSSVADPSASVGSSAAGPSDLTGSPSALADPPSPAGAVLSSGGGPQPDAITPAGGRPGSVVEAAAELLVFEGVTSGYHEGPVLREVSLTVRAGEIVALLGANGAGKTTLIRTAAGQLPVSSGQLTLLGERVRRPASSALARRGLAVVPQGRGALGRLTVRENLRMAAGRHNRGEIDRVLGWFPPLTGLLDRPAGELSGGERQRLALAVALVRRPRLLLVDELSFGLAPGVAPRLLELLRAIAAETSTGVLLVEQFAGLALRVADRGYVLDRGRVALTASAAELAARPDLIEVTYLGQ